MIIAVNGGFRLVFDGQVILCILVIFAKKGIRPFLAQKSKDAQENLARPRFRFGLITSGGASLHLPGMGWKLAQAQRSRHCLVRVECALSDSCGRVAAMHSLDVVLCAPT